MATSEFNIHECLSGIYRKMQDNMEAYVKSYLKNECFSCIRELSEMGVNRTWSPIMYELFTVDCLIETESKNPRISVNVRKFDDKEALIRLMENDETKEISEEHFVELNETLDHIIDNVNKRTINVAQIVSEEYIDEIKSAASAYIKSYLEKEMHAGWHQ